MANGRKPGASLWRSAPEASICRDGDAARFDGDSLSPGPYRSKRGLYLAGSVDPDTRLPPTP